MSRMVSLTNAYGEEHMGKLCETGKHSASYASDVLNSKYKRRKVSVIRDFPEGFEQKHLGYVGTIGNLLGNKDNADYSGDDSVEAFEIDVAVSQHSDPKEVLDLYTDPPKNLENTKLNSPSKNSGHEHIGLIDSMKSMNGSEEKTVLENDSQPLDMDELSSSKMRPDILPKIDFPKRRVTAFRSFPLGCGRNAAHLSMDDHLKALDSFKNKDLDYVGAIGNSFGHKDCENCSEDDFVEAFEDDVGSMQNSVPSELHGLYSDSGSMVERIVGSDPKEVLELYVDSPKFLEDAKLINPSKILEHEHIGLIDTVKSMNGLEVKPILENESQDQDIDEWSSSKMRPGMLPKIYVPQRRESVVRCFPPGCGRHAARRVSSVRCFPPGCGRHTARLTKEDCLKALASFKNKGLGPHNSTHFDEKGQPKSKEGVTLTNKAIQQAKSPKIKLERTDKKKTSIQSICMSNKVEDDFGISEGKQGKESLTDMEDSDRNLSGVSACDSIASRIPTASEHQPGRVVVQALMAAQSCLWRRSKRATNSSTNVKREAKKY